jgi:lysophospholipase L1-like esterase
VTVAIFGDSVAEGYTTPGYRRNALVPRLLDALVKEGDFVRGGQGLKAMVPFEWELGDWVTQQAEQTPEAAWRLVGIGGLPAFDGPSGYSAVTRSPAARAALPVSDPLVALLYTTSRQPSRFTVQAGQRVWEVDAWAPGPPRPARVELRLPEDARRVVVRGPRSGELTLTGAIARQPLTPRRTQVEVSNLAHAGRFPQFDAAPRVLSAIAEQRFDLTVFMWSYNSEMATLARPQAGDAAALYEPALLRRARLARRDGGLCVIADSTPLPVPASVKARFSAIHRRVARQAGCEHTDVLARVWSNPWTAHRRGLTQLDRVHPTPAAYRLMARALAGVLGGRVRASVVAQH